jgi:hypothetical protein
MPPRNSIRIFGNRYRPVRVSYFFFRILTLQLLKICVFEFWVRRPNRPGLALVAATAARFRGVGGRGGGDHGGGGPLLYSSSSLLIKY